MGFDATQRKDLTLGAINIYVTLVLASFILWLLPILANEKKW
jgi:hypothetical protein